MASNDYHFITYWRVKGTLAEVSAILGDATDLPRWWPSVYLAAHRVVPGDAQHLGEVIDLYTKGWLPYTLRWRFQVTEVVPDRSISLAATGDFVGQGTWAFVQDGEWAQLSYDWRVSAAKPLLRNLSFLLKPIFAANHEWAMAMGETSLKLELARRRASTPEERSRIPPPPGPTFRWLIDTTRA